MPVVLRSYKPAAGGEPSAPVPPRAYTIQDLGLHLDGSPLLPAALNDHGHLAAITVAPGAGSVHQGLCLTGYLRTPAHQAVGIDPVRSIARNGFAAGTAGENARSFRAWCTPRGVFGGALWPEFNSIARGINTRGHTVGEVHMQAEGQTFSRAFFLGDTSEPRLLTPPRGGTTAAVAINDTGDVLLNEYPFRRHRLPVTGVVPAGRPLHGPPRPRRFGLGGPGPHALQPRGRLVAHRLGRKTRLPLG